MKRYTLVFVALMLLVGCSQQPVKEVKVVPLINPVSMEKMRHYSECTVVFRLSSNIAQSYGKSATAEHSMNFARGAEIVAKHVLWIDYFGNNQEVIFSEMKENPGMWRELIDKSEEQASYTIDAVSQRYAALSEGSEETFYATVNRNIERCTTDESLNMQQAYLDVLRSI